MVIKPPAIRAGIDEKAWAVMSNRENSTLHPPRPNPSRNYSVTSLDKIADKYGVQMVIPAVWP